MLYTDRRKKQLCERHLDLFNSFEITLRLVDKANDKDWEYY